MKKIVLVAIIAAAGTLINAAEENVAAAIAAQKQKIAEARATVTPAKIGLFADAAVNRAAAAGDSTAQKAQEAIGKAKENIRRIKGGQDILK